MSIVLTKEKSITEQDVKGEQDAQGKDGVGAHRMTSRRMVSDSTEAQSNSSRAHNRMG